MARSGVVPGIDLSHTLSMANSSYGVLAARMACCSGLRFQAHRGMTGLAGLGLRRRRKVVYELAYSSSNGAIRAKVTNNSNSSDQASSSPKEQQRSLLNLPGAIWRQALDPLSNFGFGRRSVWEGGVGLFVLSGMVVLVIALVWAKGKQIRAQTRKYVHKLHSALHELKFKP